MLSTPRALLLNSCAEYAKIHLIALRGLNTGHSSEQGQSQLNHTSNKHNVIILENTVNFVLEVIMDIRVRFAVAHNHRKTPEVSVQCIDI